MGILNFGNALAEAGKGLAGIGLEGVKSMMEQDKLRLADELASAREEKSDIRKQEFAQSNLKLAEELKFGTVVKEFEYKYKPENVALVADAGALASKAAAQAKIDVETNPLNVTATANAKAIVAKAEEKAKAEVIKTMGQDPLYLKSVKDLALAQNPEKAAQIAASNATAAAANFTLQVQKEVKGLQQQLSATKDPAEQIKLKEKITGLTWTIEGDRAQRTSDAALLTSIEKNIKDIRIQASVATLSDDRVAELNSQADRLQQSYNILVKEALKNRSAETPPPPAAAVTGAAGKPTDTKIPAKSTSEAVPAGYNGWDSASKSVYVNGKVVGQGDTADSAQAIYNKYKAK